MKGVKRRAFALTSILGVVAVAVSGCGSSSSASTVGSTAASTNCNKKPKTVTIGATLPLTGSGAPFGALFRNALQIAANRINANGGADGAKLELKVLDDKALAGPAVVDATQLIKQDNVIGIATAYNDPPLAQYKVGERYKVPILNGGGNDPAVLNKPYLWTNASILTKEAELSFKYAKEHGVKKIGILAATNYTNFDIETYHKLANEIFGSEQPLVTFGAEATNVTPQLQQLVADKPEYISPLSSGLLTQMVAKDMTQANIKIPILGTGSTLVEEHILEQPSWENAIAAIPYAEPASWLNEEVEKTEKRPANIYHVFYANIAYIVKGAVEEMEKKNMCVDGASLNTLIEEHAKKDTPFEGSNGPVYYKPDHSAKLEYTISKAEKGKIVTLKKYAAS